MERGYISGRMGEHIVGVGNWIWCMDWELIHGKMEGYIMGIMRMIRRMDMECIYGLMEELIWDNGWMGNKQMKEFTFYLMILLSMGHGKVIEEWGSGFNWMNKNKINIEMNWEELKKKYISSLIREMY